MILTALMLKKIRWPRMLFVNARRSRVSQSTSIGVLMTNDCISLNVNSFNRTGSSESSASKLAH
jgi:hypothetical protein